MIGTIALIAVSVFVAVFMLLILWERYLSYLDVKNVTQKVNACNECGTPIPPCRNSIYCPTCGNQLNYGERMKAKIRERQNRVPKR